MSGSTPSFATATKDYVFYTDGDAQYDPAEMTLLWEKMRDDVDWVNGWKISRSDPMHRIIIGRLYHHTVKVMFGLQVRDVDCDFRLMRRSIFDRVRLEKDTGVICLEMMRKIQAAGFRIGTPLLPGAKVTAKILENKRGPKVIVFKKRRRHNYRRKNGHRQNHTILKIVSIGA